MKQNEIFIAADKAGNFSYGDNSMYRVSSHKWSVGFQWNPYLRAAHPRGRYPAYLSREDPDYFRSQWIDHRASLPRRTGYTQAINPGELEDPASTAEAWDSWDIDSAPMLKSQWGNKLVSIDLTLTPGWHAGVYQSGGRGILNGGRHEGSPSILYADGHVEADAEKVGQFSSGSPLAGLKAITWDEWDTTFGNMHRLIPRREFDP